MSEFSMPWPTSTHGDGQFEYTAAQWWSLFGDMFGEGVAPKVSGALKPGATLPIAIAPGRAVVGGVLYVSDSLMFIDVSAPIADTAYRIVLQKNDTTQTVRLELISSPSGVTEFPSYTNALPIVAFVLNSAGTVSNWVDERVFLGIRGIIESSDVIEVNNPDWVDNITIEGVSNKVQVKNRGVSYEKLGAGAVKARARIGREDSWSGDEIEGAVTLYDLRETEIVQLIGSTETLTIPSDSVQMSHIISPFSDIQFIYPPHIISSISHVSQDVTSKFVWDTTTNQIDGSFQIRMFRIYPSTSEIEAKFNYIITGTMA